VLDHDPGAGLTFFCAIPIPRPEWQIPPCAAPNILSSSGFELFAPQQTGRVFELRRLPACPLGYRSCFLALVKPSAAFDFRLNRRLTRFECLECQLKQSVSHWVSL
jgi:hypothetical protein